jgi:RNA polymerase sigma factor (sigma-70 family)
MATIHTTYTSHDLAPYYASLRGIPRLTREEQQRLAAHQSTAQAGSLAKQQLIEGHLRLATRIAIDHCPGARRDLFPDMVQEANLALVEAASRFDYEGFGNFTAYACAWMHARIKQTLGEDTLILIPWHAKARARREGTLDRLHDMQPVSLDQLLDEHDADSDLHDRLAAPPTLPEAPLPNVQRRLQVDALLAYLSPRAQAVLRLRFGLYYEDDERPRSVSEVARELGISRDMARVTEQDALSRLRAFAAGEAILVARGGKLCISLPERGAPTVTPERRGMLHAAYSSLDAQGIAVTARLLADETGLPRGVTGVFLRDLREETRAPQHTHIACTWRLEEGLAQMQATGERVSSRGLARTAQVSRQTAINFIRARRRQATSETGGAAHA